MFLFLNLYLVIVSLRKKERHRENEGRGQVIGRKRPRKNTPILYIRPNILCK